MNAPNKAPALPAANEAPTRLKPNELLKMHGPMGGLVRRLERYGRLGWILFFITFALFWLLVAISTLAPKSIIVVDQTGKIIGEYRASVTRAEADYVNAGTDFLRDYLSLNSSTIYEDYARALNMMAPELSGQKRAAIKRDGYLARVAELRARSWIELGRQELAPAVIERRDNGMVVRFRGQIITQLASAQTGGDGEEKRQPFDITLVMAATPRTADNSHGVEIVATKDN